jgi:coniferyl-aldehyde dehydrogenase
LDLASPPVEIPVSELQAALKRLRSDVAEPVGRAARVDLLNRLEALLRENLAPLSQAIHQDFSSRSEHETQMLEFFPSLEAIRHARSHVRSWMRPRRSFASLWFMPASTEIRPQALGVVGIIVPWNYPVLLAVAPLVSALAAGNKAMIKMSELTPRTGELFATLVGKYFPRGEVVVVNGGPETGKAFASLPFDHLLFTGSTAVGRHVMRSAAEHLTPVTLELGGKSPAIVADDFPLDVAAQRILFGKCLNAGQTCIAPDYLLVPKGKEEAFVNEARAAVAKLYPTLKANPDYSAIVNERHLQRLTGYLDEAKTRGARIEALNPAGEDLAGTRKLAPTLLLNAGDELRVMQDEIFGPILPIVPYTSLDEAIRYVNARPRPLALYVFSHDGATVDQVLDCTIAGGVSVNETIMHISQDHLPFGGVGPSGMGHYHGKFGFDTFSKLKPVFRQSRLNGLGLFHPPFGKRFKALIKLLTR